jgi:uncharacterized protein
MQLFVNLPVKDLERSQAFFTSLGFGFFGVAPGMASAVINEETQVMLLDESTFARFASKDVGDPTTSTQVILVLGLETPAEVDELVDKAVDAGATPVGIPSTGEETGRYQRGFADLDGYHWEGLCLVQPAG